MKNIHVLPTETKLAKLQLDRDYGKLTIFDKPCIRDSQDYVGANIYITSDKEIKDVRPHKDKWQLDKDLLCTDYKVYSPITCCFIPQEINCLLKEQKETTGTVKVKNKYKSQIGVDKIHNHIGTFDSLEDANKAYKEEKKKYILSVAGQYKEQLNINVYHKLINYEV